MAILIEESVWRNSQLSVARFYGGITIQGNTFYVIPPKNDLVDAEFAKFFMKLGRDKFIDTLKDHNHDSKEELKTHFDYLVKVKARRETMRTNNNKELSLF